MTSDISRILNAIEQGDPNAASELLPLVYDELRRLAAIKMSREAPGQTLQPTGLVHEAFLRLVGDDDASKWDNRGHFFAAAAEAMRRILIEHARRKKAVKHGGGMVRCEFREDDAVVDANDSDTLLALDEALSRLAKVDGPLVRLVELRYFTGLTVEETAQVLSVSPRTVKRDWAYARAWLRREIEGDS